MAKFALALPLALTLTSLAAFAEAHAFLAQPAMIARAEVEQALRSELSGFADTAHLLSIQETLGPMYKALPKTEGDKLEPLTVRYALHRYFVQKHGWFIQGLNPSTSAGQAASQAGIVKGTVPSYIQMLFENTHEQGLSLRDLAVFAATLTDLIHNEAVESLEGIFQAQQLPTVGPVNRSLVDVAIRASIITYLLGGDTATLTKRSTPAQMEQQLRDIYPSWDDTSAWASDLRHAHERALLHHSNPFSSGDLITYDESAAFVQEFGHNFGPFQNLECHHLKGRLLEMEHQGTGRVHLSEFYQGHTDAYWPFMESVQYLRHLGALDETDPRNPSVVIPNYVNAPSNCLMTSGFYAVCCFNECEGLLGHLEQRLATPTAMPRDIVEVVSHLQSETVEAPRNLSAALVARLSGIAELHDGRVPLHGRLFQQWMHHAYPRECPFPHIAGTTTSLTPEDWMAATGIDYLAKIGDVLEHVHAPSAPDREAADLPWTNEEQLIARHRWGTGAQRTASATSWVRICMSLAALSSLVVMVVHAAGAVRSSPSQESKMEKYMV